MITGLSGSGKSSLAFDTIYAEGQRRYVETLSAYARQFLDQMERPDVDSIDGLSPSIAIEQKTTSRSPRSTVGTITEIYDYLRLLYSSVGVPHCPQCGRQISRQSADQIVQQVMELKPEDRVMVMAPIVRGRKGRVQEGAGQAGAARVYTRARIDGELRNIADEEIKLDKRKNHTIELVVDRLLVKPGIERRLAASVELAMKLANGLVQVAVVGGEERLYSSKLACPGVRHQRAGAGAALVLVQQPVWRLSGVQWSGQQVRFRSGEGDHRLVEAAAGRRPGAGLGVAEPDSHRCSWRREAYGFDLSTPFEKLPRKTQNLILYGPEQARRSAADSSASLPICGRRWKTARSEGYRDWLLDHMSATTCPACHGKRLRPESLAVKVNGMSIADFTALPVSRAVEAAAQIKLSRARESASPDAF